MGLLNSLWNFASNLAYVISYRNVEEGVLGISDDYEKYLGFLEGHKELEAVVYDATYPTFGYIPVSWTMDVGWALDYIRRTFEGTNEAGGGVRRGIRIRYAIDEHRRTREKVLYLWLETVVYDDKNGNVYGTAERIQYHSLTGEWPKELMIMIPFTDELEESFRQQMNKGQGMAEAN